MTRLRSVLDADITEKAFMQTVIDYARLNRWMAYHTYDSRRSEPGVPDLLLVRPATDRCPGQLLYAELKTQTGRVSAAQIRWIDGLRSAGAEVVVWRPSDWPQIVARLKRRHTLPVEEGVA